MKHRSFMHNHDSKVKFNNKVVISLGFPTIHTNFWDAVIAIPSVMVITQIIKIFLKTQKRFVPLIALIVGLAISVFVSHRHQLIAGLFMGYFYGYAAIGSYAALKTSLLYYRKNENISE